MRRVTGRSWLTTKQAKAKGLCVLTGTQRHHQRAYVESFKRIQQGMIGEITGGNVYWNQPMLWYRSREKGWSDMEWMLRDWVNWKWLSGDHIVEQHVHNIDVFNWFFGYKQPISATAFGSRQRRVTGDQYDNFSVDFEYENGVHVHSMSRQIDGCDTNISEFIHGTKGTWESGPMVSGACVIKDLDGNVLWSYDLEAEKTEHQQNDPYTLEHVNWISSIRNNTPFVQAEETALSNMCGIMGRESAYTGKTITWEQMTGFAFELRSGQARARSDGYERLYRARSGYRQVNPFAQRDGNEAGISHTRLGLFFRDALSSRYANRGHSAMNPTNHAKGRDE